MSTHNICFRGEIRKLLTWYPHLSRPMWCLRTCPLGHPRPLVQIVTEENLLKTFLPLYLKRKQNLTSPCQQSVQTTNGKCLKFCTPNFLIKWHAKTADPDQTGPESEKQIVNCENPDLQQLFQVRCYFGKRGDLDQTLWRMVSPHLQIQIQIYL